MCSRVTQSAKLYHRFRQASGITDILAFNDKIFTGFQHAGQHHIMVAANDGKHNFITESNFGFFYGDSFLFNARAETASVKSLWAGAAETQRVLIPVDSFYEHGFYIRPQGEDLTVLGGISLFDMNGVRTTTLLTCDSVNEMRPVHARMPVVIPKDKWLSWLDPQVRYYKFGALYNRKDAHFVVSDQPLSEVTGGA